MRTQIHERLLALKAALINSALAAQAGRGKREHSVRYKGYTELSSDRFKDYRDD